MRSPLEKWVITSLYHTSDESHCEYYHAAAQQLYRNQHPQHSRKKHHLHQNYIHWHCLSVLNLGGTTWHAFFSYRAVGKHTTIPFFPSNLIISWTSGTSSKSMIHLAILGFRLPHSTRVKMYLKSSLNWLGTSLQLNHTSLYTIYFGEHSSRRLNLAEVIACWAFLARSWKWIPSQLISSIQKPDHLHQSYGCGRYTPRLLYSHPGTDKLVKNYL